MAKEKGKSRAGLYGKSSKEKAPQAFHFSYHMKVIMFSIVSTVLAIGVIIFELPEYANRSLVGDVIAKDYVKNADSKTVGKMRTSFPHKMLKHKYTMNFDLLMKERRRAMMQYSFPYNKRGVDKREKLSLEEFRAVYDGKWPVIVTDVVSKWPASNWTKEFFISNYGDQKVVMKAVYNTTVETLSLPLELYLAHLEHSKETAWTYLQDELFLVQRPELRRQIPNSIYTQENFFYLFPRDIQPWDCMLLWGTAHSRSTLHIDPYNWTGTNAVLYGKKKWKLLPPGQDHFLSLPEDLGNCGFPMDCVKYNSPLDIHTIQKVDESILEGLDMLEVEQNPGEMLIIPTGWFHQAYNLVPTLAVSGQLMNGRNYMVVLEEMMKGGGISRRDLPDNADQMNPESLVSYLASRVAPEVIKRGAETTAGALKQLKS